MFERLPNYSITAYILILLSLITIWLWLFLVEIEWCGMLLIGDMPLIIPVSRYWKKSIARIIDYLLGIDYIFMDSFILLAFDNLISLLIFLQTGFVWCNRFFDYRVCTFFFA